MVDLNRSNYYYKRLRDDNEDAIINRMRAIIAKHKNWGFSIIHKTLRREGLVKNHKRTWRIYKEHRLTIKDRSNHTAAP